MNKFPTFASAFENILKNLVEEPDYIIDPRAQNTKELINYSFCIENPLSSLLINKEHSSNLNYIAGELVWYFRKQNDLEYISKYSSFWNKVANEDGTCNSAYGHLIFNGQYQWALNCLEKDINSRQAVIHFNNETHQFEGNKDFVCTMYVNLFIRENKLHLSTQMRSNDVIFGLINDVAFFTTLQQQALLHLQKTYPDLEVGFYYHYANSLHLYERHFDKARKMLKNPCISGELPKLNRELITRDGLPSHILVDIENRNLVNLKDEFYRFLKTNI